MAQAQEGSRFIPHSIGVYFTPQGQDFFAQDLEGLFYNNGISINQAYFGKFQYETQEKYLEEMIPNQHQLANVIRTLREGIARYLVGLELGKHKFQIDFEDLDVAINWRELGIEIIDPQLFDDELESNTPTLTMNLNLEVDRFQLSVGKVRARDINHPIFGEIGLDDLMISMQQNGPALYLNLPVNFYSSEKKGFYVEVGTPDMNLEALNLGMEYRPPMILPSVELNINGHSITVNQDEVELLFNEQKEQIFQTAQRELQIWADENAAAFINQVAMKKIDSGLIETNTMLPPGAPNIFARNFEWGLKVAGIDMFGDHLHIGLDGFVTDPTQSNDFDLDQSLQAQALPHMNSSKLQGRDLALSLNQGFVNKIIKLSSLRGYFSHVELDAGESIKLTKTPVLKLDQKKPALQIEVEYEVEGIQGWFVKNPIRISFDLMVDFVADAQGQISLIGRGVNLDTVFLDSKYIRLFTSKVRAAAKDEIKEMQSDLDGYVIMEGLPLPDALFGIPMIKKNAEIDKNGHLLIYLDFLKY
jgi:hypothetical protein